MIAISRIIGWEEKRDGSLTEYSEITMLSELTAKEWWSKKPRETFQKKITWEHGGILVGEIDNLNNCYCCLLWCSNCRCLSRWVSARIILYAFRDSYVVIRCWILSILWLQLEYSRSEYIATDRDPWFYDILDEWLSAFSLSNEDLGCVIMHGCRLWNFLVYLWW